MSNYVSEVVSVLSRSRQMILCLLHSLYSLSGRGPQLAYYLYVSSVSICLSYKKVTFSGGAISGGESKRDGINSLRYLHNCFQ